MVLPGSLFEVVPFEGGPLVAVYDEGPSCLLLTTSLGMGPLVAVYDEGHLCWSPQISKKSVYLSKKVLKLKIFLNSPKFDEFYMRGIFAFAST